MGEENQAQASEEAQEAPKEKSNTKKEPVIAEQTTKDKIIKLIVVGIYLCGVSGTGFTLALYYFFFWDSRMPEIYKKFNKF